MIDTQILMWLGTIAVALIFYGLRVSISRYRDGVGSLEGVVAFSISLVFWGLFAMHSSNYLIGTGGGTETLSSQSLMMLGILGVGVALILLFDGVLKLVR